MDDIYITQSFSVKEFMCHNGTPYPTDWIIPRLKPLCQALEKIRALTNQPMTIESGYRTKEWNDAIYAAKKEVPTKSKHCEGIAADIVLDGMAPHELYNAISVLIRDKVIPNGGLGLYRWGCHYDIRCLIDNEPAARWVKE